MWCTKVLVAFDGSEASRNAVAKALAIAQEEPQAQFLFVHAMKLYAMGSSAVGALIEDANATVDTLTEMVSCLGERAQVKMLRGTSPAELILRCAREEDCDLIIMGSRGCGGVKGFLGSVSYAVVQSSPVTVLIAKEGAE